MVLKGELVMKTKKIAMSVLAGTTVASTLSACEKEETITSLTIPFGLYSTVYDYGEAIDRIVLDTDDAPIDVEKLSAETFTIQAVSTSPYTDEEQLKAIEDGGLQHTGIYDEKREISEITSEENDVVLNLVTTYETPGKGTLDFVANFETLKGCNMLLNVAYTITLNEDITLKDGTVISKDNVTFVQEDGIHNAEVEKFEAGEYDGMKYQLYEPENADEEKLPLIVWTHGGGESGYQGVIYDNVEQLKANRGALAFAEDETQEIFGGAYVLAPQTPNEWSDCVEQLKNVVDHVVEEYPIDTSRIYIFGCSAGGYMVLDQIVHYPDFYAAAVATCPAIDTANINTYGDGRIITDEELSSITTPLWLVQSKDDKTVSYTESAERVYNLLKDKGAILTSYDNVTVDGTTYDGHNAWIYTARNMPEHDGKSVFAWTAEQKLSK